MAYHTRDLTLGEQLFDELPARIVGAEEAGQPLDRQALLPQHAEYAVDLCRFLCSHNPVLRAEAQGGRTRLFRRDSIFRAISVALCRLSP